MTAPSPEPLPWRIDPEIRALLVCPACRGALQDHPAGLRCQACALLYPVVEDIPWLIPEEARPSPDAA
ncbi:MAG: Trm112 family protein [Pseudomonadota bacterium]